MRTLMACAGFIFFAGNSFSFAQTTHLWTQSRFEDYEKGTPIGVAVASDGRLHAGPGLTEILTTPSTFAWAVTVDKNGTAYVGTGSPATVLRTGTHKGEKPFTLFETKDLSVQVVRIGPDGSLYAATLPSGKVYKIDPAATSPQDAASAKVVFDEAKVDPKSDSDKSDPGAHYIWDMTFDSQGRLYIATGGPAAVYRVDVTKPNAQPELFFKSDEQHIRALAWDGAGNLIAGSDGSGLVYRISPEGKGYVLFDAPRREITSVAVGADGTIYAANVGEKGHNPLPPLPVTGVATVTFTIVQPGSLQAANTSSSLPEGTDIYAIHEGQAPRKLWTGKDEVVYAMAARADGLLALSGNRGHIFRIQSDGSYADVAHLDAQQGLSLAVHGSEGAVLIGSGNTGKLFSLGASENHEYASDVLDAGALSRFGRMEIEPGSSGYEIWTRSGNVEQPIRGWTDWEPLKDGSVASPAGRFLQWKAVLHNGGSLGSVSVNYLPVNAAPVIDDIVVVPGARVTTQVQPPQQQTVSISFNAPAATPATDESANSAPLQATKDRGSITVRWAAHDDNGDDLIYSLYLRGDGERAWRLLKKNLSDKAYSFDATQIPDGGYEVKIEASDAPSHSPSDALTASKVSDRFVVDTTAPVVSGLKASEEAETCDHDPCPMGGRASFDADDATSPIARAEYSVDAAHWQFLAPVGGLSDSKHEHYELHVPASALKGTGEHLITVRVYDRYDNVGLAKTVFGSEDK